MPKAVMESLITGSPKVGKVLGILNLSPYDACLEKVCLKWGPRSERDVRTLSVSTKLDHSAYSEKLCAFTLMEDIYANTCSNQRFIKFLDLFTW